MRVIHHSKMSLENFGLTLEIWESNKVFVSHKKSHLLAALYPPLHTAPPPLCRSSLRTQYRFSISITWWISCLIYHYIIIICRLGSIGFERIFSESSQVQTFSDDKQRSIMLKLRIPFNQSKFYLSVNILRNS